jgi:predicted RNA binding protein YcfA (HicA-like mRNA interferase family)
VSRKNHIIIARLKKKGFSTEMSKHIKLTFQHNGCDTQIRTWVSHGKKEIGDRLLSLMAEQLHLSKQQFTEAIDCRVDGEALILIYDELDLL